MEISRFIQQALKDGSLDKVSKGIEQLVVMTINAIGMIEHTQLELTQRIETIEEDLDVIKDFLLSKPVPLPGSTQPSPTAPIPAKSQPTPASSPVSSSSTQADSTPASPISQSIKTESPILSPSEQDIIEFRKKLLKPVPKHEKVKTQPVSIRAALLQEMKDFFGSAMTKVEKEKKDTD